MNYLANTYEFVCKMWPLLPYYIPTTQMLFKPFHYIFNITNKCNLKCPYCCQKASMSRTLPELSAEEILSITGKLPWYAIIALSGGEPLCREDILKIVEGITEQKKKISLLTNGLLLNDTIIDGIIKYKLLNIGIAIDGDKQYYESIKGKGNYSVLMDKINRLAYNRKKKKSCFPAIDWKVTVFPENVGQIPLLYKQSMDYGADTFTVSLPKKNDFQFNDCLHGREILDSITESTHKLLYPDNMVKMYEELFALSRHSKTMLRTYPRLKQAEDIDNYFNNDAIQEKYCICREPWTGLVISAIGEAYPCLSIKIGDMKKQTLSQILMSPENSEFRKQLKKKGLFSVCDGCCYASLKPVSKKEKAIRA